MVNNSDNKAGNKRPLTPVITQGGGSLGPNDVRTGSKGVPEAFHNLSSSESHTVE